MATTNHERVGKSLDLLRAGLGPFVDREVQASLAAGRLTPPKLQGFIEDPMLASKPPEQWDAAALLKMMWDTWNDVFRITLGHAERTFVSELREVGNRWAHR